jgi:Flp pilus assembly protein TadB
MSRARFDRGRSEQMRKEEEQGEVVTHVSEVEARSGSRTRVTRNILVISLLLVVILLVAAVTMGFFETAQTGADGVNAGNSANAAQP